MISGDEEVTMDEIGQIIDYVKDCSGIHTDLIWGNGTDPALGTQDQCNHHCHGIQCRQHS